MNKGTPNNRKRPSRTTRLAMNGVMAALVIVLGFLSIRIGNIMKITFEDLPIMFSAMMFGPVDAVAVAFVGIFLYQLLSYGITATTALWVLPFVVAALVVGGVAKKSDFRNTDRQIFLLCVVGQLLIWSLNTVAIYADSKIYGYYYPTIVTGMLAIRLAVAVAKGVALGLLMPPVLKKLAVITRNGM